MQWSPETKIRLKAKWQSVGLLLGNFTYRQKLSYIVESIDWAIWQVGQSLINEFNRQSLISSRLTTSTLGLKNSILHFGSLHTALHGGRLREAKSSNQRVLSVFHLLPDSPKNLILSRLHDHFALIHTSNQITEQALIKLGIPADKIKVIPLGVDLGLFQTPASGLRENLGIENSEIVIGSFQKDGQGWGEGSEPKLEKGVDILTNSLIQLSKLYPIRVLLVGPARGYLKKRLGDNHVKFIDIGYLTRSSDVLPYYQILDLYLIAARVEGGPLSLLESWASGVPVVSTRVGMAPDLAQADHDIVFADEISTDAVVQATSRLLNNADLRARLSANGRQSVQEYSWTNISRLYFDKLYQPLLK